MIATILLPALVALVGALAYGLSSNSKVQEMGRAAWATGLGVTLLVAGHGTTSVTSAMTVAVPLLVVIVAALVYALASGKIVQLARLAFWVGLGVLLYELGQHPIHIG